MRIIDADKFLAYLIFSKNIDGLTCGEVKEAIEMCKVNVLEKIRAEVKALSNSNPSYWHIGDMVDRDDVLEILDKYKAENEDEE